MSHQIWWAVFIISLSLLTAILLRGRRALQWLILIGMNIVIAAVLLYALNWFGTGYGVHMPLNITTLSTVGIFGVPGLLLLIALKGTLIGFG